MNAGKTKIYMRESQKMSLDYKLHTKIIESIIMIQRWFKTKIQREKFTSCRCAAVKIQSFWRMRMAQQKLFRLKVQNNAALVIQSTWRMFKERKMYKKLLNGLITIQAHIRGKAARIRFKRNHRQKMLKERYKLRPTQSLPINDRSIDGDTVDVEISRSYPKLVQYSFDLPIENVANVEQAAKATEQDEHILHKAENQFRSLMVSAKSSDGAKVDDVSRYRESEESVDSRTPRSYNLDSATKQYFDDSIMTKR